MRKDEAEDQLDAIDDKKLRYRELNMNKAAILKEKYHQTICVPIEFEEEHQPSNCEGSEVVKEEACLKETSVAVKDPKDPMFKSFFFKNAIFRTAQSIIENHEKKNTKNKEGCETNPTTIASINNSTTPTTQLKKRDFSLKSRLKGHNSTTATVLTSSVSAEITTLLSPSSPLVAEKSKGMSKSSSTSSLTMKVPGTACMIKESIQPQIKTERGQSGLLRFFESPVFNIHFAIHYLFYSKEPGVLTFIGNKIFR